jgi:hypothetical protein
MATQNKSILRRLLSTESEWNPKVVIGRGVVRVLPESVLHRLKKRYYAYLMKHVPEDWVERDALIAKQLVSPGDSVLDIGANIGQYSRLLSSWVGPNGQVYAFEPIPQIFDFLSNNVRSRKLDTFFEERGATPPISFVKRDANFHELAVLRGALRTIRDSQPAMLIEVNPDPDDAASTAFETFELLRAAGLNPYWFDGNKLIPRKPGERSQNYFFLAPKHVTALADRIGKVG